MFLLLTCFSLLHLQKLHLQHLTTSCALRRSYEHQDNQKIYSHSFGPSENPLAYTYRAQTESSAANSQKKKAKHKLALTCLDSILVEIIFDMMPSDCSWAEMVRDCWKNEKVGQTGRGMTEHLWVAASSHLWAITGSRWYGISGVQSRWFRGDSGTRFRMHFMGAESWERWSAIH